MIGIGVEFIVIDLGMKVENIEVDQFGSVRKIIVRNISIIMIVDFVSKDEIQVCIV